MNYNTVIIAGRVCRDIELRYSPKGTPCARIGMAINRRWKTESGEAKEEVTFLDVDAFGRTAENCHKFLKKGSGLHVTGRLRMDQWDDKQTGQKRSKLGVVADSVQFVSEGKSSTTDAPATAPAPAAAPAAEAGDDDVPF